MIKIIIFYKNGSWIDLYFAEDLLFKSYEEAFSYFIENYNIETVSSVILSEI